jgi:hypothetical protein
MRAAPARGIDRAGALIQRENVNHGPPSNWFFPSLKQVMRQYSPEYLMRYSTRRSAGSNNENAALAFDKQFERNQREQERDIKKAFQTGKKFYKKAKEITERLPTPSLSETEGALGAGDRTINVAGQMVGVTGLSARLIQLALLPSVKKQSSMKFWITLLERTCCTRTMTKYRSRARAHCDDKLENF